MQPPRPQYISIVDSHSDNNSNAQAAQNESKLMEQQSVRSQLSRIGTVNESVKNSLNDFFNSIFSRKNQHSKSDIEMFTELYKLLEKSLEI